MMKLKFQYFGHLMWRADSLEKTLVLGTTEDKRKGWQRMRRLDGINSMDISLSKFWEIVKYRWAWHAVVHRVTNSQNDLVAEWQPGYNQISCKPLTAAYFSLFMWKLVSQVTYLLSVAWFICIVSLFSSNYTLSYNNIILDSVLHEINKQEIIIIC